MNRCIPTNFRRQAGVTMVEFIIITPIAVMLVLGIIQLGLMFSAKQILNEAVFMGARAGSINNASVAKIQSAIVTALVPFYQDSTDTIDDVRVSRGFWAARNDVLSNPDNLVITLLSPNADAFSDFGLTVDGKTQIPNDNLEYRDYTILGAATKMSIQDANVLKIKVVYGYQLKVPLMTSVLRATLCGFDSGVNAFGRGGTSVASEADNCTKYYSQGRIPIEAYATVNMQTPAQQD